MGIVTLFLVTIVVAILKFSIAEPRPVIALKNVHLLVSEIDPYSFPSGHTTNAFALATVFGLNWKIPIFKRTVKLIWILIPIAAIVGFSRIYIGVHYPLDVLCGAIIGIILGVIATKIGKNYLKS
jgi:undecaprenyl-diphosphatase